MSQQPKRPGIATWLAAFVVMLVLYVLSAGPAVIATYRSIEVTGIEEIEYILFLYYPIIVCFPEPLGAYAQWWAWLFGVPI